MSSSVLQEKEEAAAAIRQQSIDETTEASPRPSQDARDALVTDGFLVPNLEAPQDAPPPTYGDHPDQVQFHQPGFDAGANVTADGRVNVNINTKTRRLNDLLAPALRHQIDTADQAPLPPAYIPPALGGLPGQTPPPQLNVVIQIVGSRGDVQPFVALGKVLKETYGHRIRIATHPTFQTFVEENGLDFFSIGGDPAELMAFMVKHPGLMPGIDALKSGEISRRRKGIQDILLGCWRSCIEPGDGLGPPLPRHGWNAPLDLSQVSVQGGTEPFVADAIIANPPSFAHIHVAEKLGIPLHMMFTMPWSPTRAFPHPLANIQSSTADDVLTNYMTYTLVEMMTWQGLGDIINRFREKALDLAPLSLIWAPGLLTRLRIPYTYCWSPSLIPKPNDWGNNIDISGFYFLDLASSFQPDPDLQAFLDEGPPPVYIGFGSIVVDDPDAMTEMIFDAVRAAGVRALVSKGWGGLGADDLGVPEGIYMLGNVPHDWLFQHVSCVVHHGGAGTTAAGIKAGKPTLVVPFFGDQPFWGAMIARAEAGPDPVPFKQLTAPKLAAAIKFCLEPNTIERAKDYGEKIREEKGTDKGGQDFHSHLDLDSMRCSIAPSRVAVWRVRRTKVRLSALVATLLVEHNILQYTDLKLYRPVEYNTEDQPPDPISAGTTSLVMDLSSITMSIADMPRELFKSRQRVEARAAAQAELSQAAEERTASMGGASSAGASTIDVADSKSQSTDLPQPEDLGEASTASTATTNPMSPTLNTTTSITSATSISDSSSRSRSRDASTHLKSAAENRRNSSPVGISIEAAMSATKGVGNIVTTGVRSPMNFCLGLAKGFRNVPRMYNDDTIRPTPKVTGLTSGVITAGKEFGYGIYDGFAGLVTQPIRGAEKGGAEGFVKGAEGLIKGVGKGIGGFLVKPSAGFWALPAYMMQGLNEEVIKLFSRSVHNHIIAARVLQGQRDLEKSTPLEQEDILARWQRLGDKLKDFEKLKKKGKETATSPDRQGAMSPVELPGDEPKTGFLRTRALSFETRKKLHAQKEAWRRAYGRASTMPVQRPDTVPEEDGAEDAEFEQAIQASVRETSRGDAEEDAQIEQAIRESVTAVRAHGGIPEPSLPQLDEKRAGIFTNDQYQITDQEYQQLIQQAVNESMQAQYDQYYGHPAFQESPTETPQPERDDAADSALDADLERALEESRNAPPLPPRASSDQEDEELQRAIAASQQHHERETSQRTEEDIVMEYIKKQSLAEEDFRRQKAKGKATVGDEENSDDDEEIRRAIEESLRISQGHGGGQASGVHGEARDERGESSGASGQDESSAAPVEGQPSATPAEGGSSETPGHVDGESGAAQGEQEPSSTHGKEEPTATQGEKPSE